jgi:D-cysteine desulfhydrase
MKWNYPESVSLAHLPTPVRKLERLTKAWGGPQIYIKRDDLTGCCLSGNKVRKLEFVVAEALARGADTLITCGGIQSNHARATAGVAARMGMNTFLVLKGKPTGDWEGNLFLDRLLGAEFTFITQEAYAHVDEIMTEVAERLQKEGRRCYIIPEGASYDIGYFGYVRASEEIVHQMIEMNVEMDYIVTATGSGGTLGGLVLGKRFFGFKAQPVGFNVNHTAGYFQDRIGDVISRMISKYGWTIDIKREEIDCIDGYVGAGYALSRPEELALITQVARMEGVVLDPVYTGKAMFGLRDQIRQGRFKKKENVLFLHTGGIYGTFPKGRDFAKIWG